MSKREKLAVLLKALDEALLDLERYAGSVGFDEFVRDRNKYRMVCHALLVAAQSAIDIAEVLVADRGLGPAQTYREAFDILARAGIFPADLAKELSGWAGLRNALVHLYTHLDLQRLYDAFTSGLDPLRRLREFAFAEAGQPGPAVT
ncbi:MAG: DUF86 domain-containing protein [Deltaproteobacteria bacterium]|nr:DUF86 domain-containing protein [Deltaproteobacteria bacterium]